MNTMLYLTAEAVSIRTGDGMVVLEVDEKMFLSPEDCIDLSRALVKAAACALGVEPSKQPDPTSGTGTA